MCKILIGDILKSNNYGYFKIISKNTNIKNYFEIEFLETKFKKMADRKSILNGEIKDTSVAHKYYKYVNVKINNLTILEVVLENKMYYGICQCDCGNKNLVKTRMKNIITNHTRSCGCLRKKLNIYEFHENYGIGYDSNNNLFYFDLEDYDKIKDYTWLVSKKGYVVSKTKGKYVVMHSLIFDNEQNNIIDHIVIENKHDNRKSNLRFTNASGNQMNRKPFLKNKYMIKGVYYREHIDKFEVRIRKDNQIINLGVFKNLKDAINTRIKKEKELFGEQRYAWENDINEEYIKDTENKIRNIKKEV